jgi:hypothetical protein
MRNAIIFVINLIVLFALLKLYSCKEYRTINEMWRSSTELIEITADSILYFGNTFYGGNSIEQFDSHGHVLNYLSLDSLIMEFSFGESDTFRRVQNWNTVNQWDSITMFVGSEILRKIWFSKIVFSKNGVVREKGGGAEFFTEINLSKRERRCIGNELDQIDPLKFDLFPNSSQDIYRIIRIEKFHKDETISFEGTEMFSLYPCLDEFARSIEAKYVKY